MNLFYPPLVTYIPLLIKLFTSSYMIALKMFAGFMIVLSGITMYKFTYNITQKRSIALFSAIFYMIAPYKLANVYKRFAIGEFTALVFIPYVFMGIYNLFEQDRKKHYYISIGAIGLMLSHTVSTLYIAIFCIIYIVFNIKKLKDKDILKKCVVNIIFILLVSMLFWFPLLEADLEADYAIMDNATMRTYGDFVYQNTISFSQLFTDIGEENGTTFVLGWPTIIALALMIITFKKIDIKYKSFYLINIILALLSLWMSTRFFPWRIMPNILCKLQYPWRMIGFLNFFISFICAINLYVILKEYVKKDILKGIIILAFTIISIVSSIFTMSQFFAKDNKKDDKYEEYIMSNKKISHMMINRDYMPLRAIKLQKTYVKDRDDYTHVLSGNGEIVEENKENLTDVIKIKNIEKGTELEFPYYYYPGYEIIIKVNGEEKKIQKIESEHGYLSCKIEENIGEAEIIVKYIGTKIVYFSYSVSFVSFIIYIVYIILENRKNKK